ncbi:hypothetical protein ACG74X_06130 [Marivita sp. S0852]|uniref:hypothetical protein n=1 Tax=Marivita sp. S0852 TaxID=3373893 RepID=UPI003981FE91
MGPPHPLRRSAPEVALCRHPVSFSGRTHRTRPAHAWANNAMASSIAQRISHTGALGYEIYCDPISQRQFWHPLWDAGKDHGMRPFGMPAMISLRLDKFFGWGSVRVFARLSDRRGREDHTPRADFRRRCRRCG